MAQVSIPLIQGAQSTNNVRDAFDSRAAQLDQQRAQEEKQKDADFHTVVKYASDGLTNEAKYFAQQKGINVPDEVFRNADFAKGLAIAGDLYDDPVSAQKFTTAYVSTQGDRMSRYNAALAAGGKPLGKDDRELNLYARKLQMQQQYGGGSADKGFSLSAGETRYDANGNVIASSPKQDDGAYEAGAKAVNAYMSGGIGVTKEGAQQVFDDAVARYEAMKPKQQTLTPPQNPYAGGGNPATSLPYDQIQPMMLDGSGNLYPPQAPQQNTQTNQIPVGLPAGSAMIGTANGRPVYRDPQGNEYIDDGNP